MTEKSINNLINELFEEIPASFDAKAETFYQFIQRKLESYVASVSTFPQGILETMLKDSKQMKGNATKRRYLNLLNQIIESCLNVLQRAYYGDVASAIFDLKELLTENKKISRYLDDVLANLFCLRYGKFDERLYRARDEELNKKIEDCWNLPFNLREKASRGRFNQTGAICMYLSNKEEICNKELGALDKKKSRWVQSFQFKKNVCLLNLLVPNINEIDNLNPTQQFNYITLYPFYLLCLSKSNNSGEKEFVEEYLFSQLFFHLIMLQKDDYLSYYDGIISTSIFDRNGFNVIIPSYYKVPNNNNSETVSGNITQKLQIISNPYQYTNN